MESLYFYEKDKEKNIIALLGKDEFMRISRTIREGNWLREGKKGCMLYVSGDENEIDNLSQKLKDIAEKITGNEEKDIIASFKAEEESAASGMGLMFG